MHEDQLRENLSLVREAIEAAARRSGREGQEVTLVAVTKSHPPEVIRAALGLGLRHIGENRIEELEEKLGILGRHVAVWHMVGHLQSRKARQAVGAADLLHSLDTLKLARRLSSYAVEDDLVLPVLIQVNVSGEGAKSGFPGDQVVEGIHQILELPGLEVKGLMTMAPFVDDEKILRRTFAGLRHTLEEAGRLPGFVGRELSMGMTHDFELAVEEGSTMVRIGTALFGERPR
jgi:PLP dependent protein